ncbi:MAG: hypothetical protein ACRDO1_12210 [Nocardioidaceae bacterium]
MSVSERSERRPVPLQRGVDPAPDNAGLPVSEQSYRAFLTLWAFFTGAESLANAPFLSRDVERDHDVRQGLVDDWARLHPRTRGWIADSPRLWRSVQHAWSDPTSDERRRKSLRRFFRPQFRTFERLWPGRAQARTVRKPA